jgi:hypothetical protein
MLHLPRVDYGGSRERYRGDGRPCQFSNHLNTKVAIEPVRRGLRQDAVRVACPAKFVSRIYPVIEQLPAPPSQVHAHARGPLFLKRPRRSGGVDRVQEFGDLLLQPVAV